MALSIFSLSCAHSHSDGCMGSHLGFGILPKDTSAWGLEEPGIETPALQLEGDPLYLQCHIHPICGQERTDLFQLTLQF